MRCSNLGVRSLRILCWAGEGARIKRLARKALFAAIMVGLTHISPASAITPKYQAHQPMTVRSYAMVQSFKAWGTYADYKCMATVFTRESHWNAKSRNRVPVYQKRGGKWVALHAFGIAQILGEKATDPKVQVDHGISYITLRYGNGCKALAFHNRHNWY